VHHAKASRINGGGCVLYCGQPVICAARGDKGRCEEGGRSHRRRDQEGAEATEKGTKKAAKGTKDAVQTTYVCKDGKTDQATLKANACKEHGGVKAEQKAKPK